MEIWLVGLAMLGGLILVASWDSIKPRPVSGTTSVDASRLPGDWQVALTSRGFSNREIQRNLNEIDDAARGRGGVVCPERRDVFRAFYLTPVSEVRVLILGQDPYLAEQDADGLAFSTRPGARIGHSLERIFSNLERDPNLQFSRPHSGDLSKWASRGVLLLNAALTVERDGTSHLWKWEPFTREVLRSVNNGSNPVVFMLWGDDANSLADRAGLDGTRHLVIRSTHPRREHPSQYPAFSSTRPFSRANDFLRSRGRGAVDWAL